MGKMTITAYTDEHFEREYKSALELPVNPDKMKLTKGIRYAEDKQLGSLNGSNVYINYRPETLYFECLFDMTNAMEDDDEKKPVREVVNNLEERLYYYNSEGHRPSFIRIQYGDILFFGQLKTLDTEYTLFDQYSPTCRTESNTDRLLQPKRGKEKIPQTLTRCIKTGHTEGRKNTRRPML